VKKLFTDSHVSDKGRMPAKCPHCGKIGDFPVFEDSTGLYINIIQLKKIHNSFFAVCPECKQTFYLTDGKNL
jgi:hypothetical protein